MLIKRYPIVKLLNILPNNHTLFDTILVTINDELVNLYLKKNKIHDISKKLFKFINLKIEVYKKKIPKKYPKLLI